MLDGTYFFECQCGMTEHVLRFTLNIEEPEIFASVFLDYQLPRYRRIWSALKYVFGYKCEYGHFGSWIMEEADVGRFKEMVAKFEKGLLNE